MRKNLNFIEKEYILKIQDYDIYVFQIKHHLIYSNLTQEKMEEN